MRPVMFSNYPLWKEDQIPPPHPKPAKRPAIPERSIGLEFFEFQTKYLDHNETFSRSPEDRQYIVKAWRYWSYGEPFPEYYIEKPTFPSQADREFLDLIAEQEPTLDCSSDVVPDLPHIEDTPPEYLFSLEDEEEEEECQFYISEENLTKMLPEQRGLFDDFKFPLAHKLNPSALEWSPSCRIMNIQLNLDLRYSDPLSYPIVGTDSLKTYDPGGWIKVQDPTELTRGIRS